MAQLARIPQRGAVRRKVKDVKFSRGSNGSAAARVTMDALDIDAFANQLLSNSLHEFSSQGIELGDGAHNVSTDRMHV